MNMDMETYTLITCKIENAVAVLTLNNPPALSCCLLLRAEARN